MIPAEASEQQSEEDETSDIMSIRSASYRRPVGGREETPRDST